VILTESPVWLFSVSALTLPLTSAPSPVSQRDWNVEYFPFSLTMETLPSVKFPSLFLLNRVPASLSF